MLAKSQNMKGRWAWIPKHSKPTVKNCSISINHVVSILIEHNLFSICLFLTWYSLHLAHERERGRTNSRDVCDWKTNASRKVSASDSSSCQPFHEESSPMNSWKQWSYMGDNKSLSKLTFVMVSSNSLLPKPGTVEACFKVTQHLIIFSCHLGNVNFVSYLYSFPRRLVTVPCLPLAVRIYSSHTNCKLSMNSNLEWTISQLTFDTS